MEKIKKLFESLKLNEGDVSKKVFNNDTIDKMVLVMESQLGEFKSNLQEKMEQQNLEEMAAWKDALVTRLDEYLNYFTNEVIKENAENIVDATKVKVAERILNNFNIMVEDFNMSLSDDSIDFENEREELHEQVNALVNENLELQESIKEIIKEKIITEATAEIKSEQGKVRFQTLVEGFDFDDPERFEHNAKLLAENINNSKGNRATTKADSSDVLVEKEEINNQENAGIMKESVTPKMKNYLEVAKSN